MITLPDERDYINKRFLIIVVGGKGEFYHHVLDSTRKEWEVFDSNEFATWDTHTLLVNALKEELPRSFLDFRRRCGLVVSTPQRWLEVVGSNPALLPFVVVSEACILVPGVR